MCSKNTSITHGVSPLHLPSAFSVSAQRATLCIKSAAWENRHHLRITAQSITVHVLLEMWHDYIVCQQLLLLHSLPSVEICLALKFLPFRVFISAPQSVDSGGLFLSPHAGTAGTAKPIRRETRSSTSSVSACTLQHKHTCTDAEIHRNIPPRKGKRAIKLVILVHLKRGTAGIYRATSSADWLDSACGDEEVRKRDSCQRGE